LLSGLSIEDCCKLFAVIPFSVVQSPALEQKLLVPMMSHCCSVAERWTSEPGRDMTAVVIMVRHQLWSSYNIIPEQFTANAQRLQHVIRRRFCSMVRITGQHKRKEVIGLSEIR
jgi:hypothetical protein